MNLIIAIQAHMARRKIRGSWATEVNFIVDEAKVASPDVMFLLDDKLRELASIQLKRGDDQMKYGRVRVPPTMVIGSVDSGWYSSDDRVLGPRRSDI